MKKLRILVATALSFSSISANAAFINTDWKVENDSQVVLQEETGIEWLKLNNTYGLSINQVLSDPIYDGWRLPEGHEVDALINDFFEISFFVEGSNYVSSGGSSWYDTGKSWVNTFGFGVLASTGNTLSLGLHFGTTGDVTSSGAMYRRTRSNGGAVSDEVGTFTSDYSSANYGVFLVSDGNLTISSINDPSINANNPNANSGDVIEVSEPATLGVLAAGLFGLMFVRRKNKKI